MPTSELVPTNAAMTPRQFCERLHRMGFVTVERGENHLVLANGARRVLLPTHSVAIPRWVERAVEWALEPSLEAGWLRRDLPFERARHAHPMVLHCCIEPDDESGWHGFIVEQYEIVTFGDTPDQVEQRLQEAAQLWFGTPARIELARVDGAGS